MSILISIIPRAKNIMINPTDFLHTNLKAFIFCFDSAFPVDENYCPYGQFRRNNDSLPPSVVFDMLFYAKSDYYLNDVSCFASSGGYLR